MAVAAPDDAGPDRPARPAASLSQQADFRGAHPGAGLGEPLGLDIVPAEFPA